MNQARPDVGQTTPIGIGIIGVSAQRGWAAAAHLPALRSLPDYEVRALSASTPASAAAAAAAHEISVACPSHLELVSRDDVELVVVTVKVPEHLRLVSAAIEAGKAVLCEWPLGNGVAEAEKLEERAAMRQVPAFVGLQARAAPAVRYVRELVQSGSLGEILSTSVLGSGDGWGQEVDPSVTYLLDRDNGATMLTIPFGHTVDALCYVLGEFTTVTATMAVRRATVRRSDTAEMVPMTAEDQIAVAGTLVGGTIASLHYRGGRSAGTNFLWEINGTEGDLLVTGRTGHLQYGRVAIQMSTRSGGPLSAITIPESLAATTANPGSLCFTVAESYAQIARDLRSGTRTAPTFTDGLRRHRMLAAIERAAETGVRQTVT